MEDVLQVYQRAYDADFPVVCLDEASKQLIGEVAPADPPAPSAMRMLMEELDCSVETTDLFAINEAFSVVTMAAQRDLNILAVRRRLPFPFRSHRPRPQPIPSPPREEHLSSGGKMVVAIQSGT